MFSEFIFILCILHSLGDEASISSVSNNQIKINLNLNNLAENPKNLLHKKNKHTNEKFLLNEKVLFEESHIINEDAIEDVKKLDSFANLINDVKPLQGLFDDVQIKKTPESEWENFVINPHTLKCSKYSFMNVIQDVMFHLAAAELAKEVHNVLGNQRADEEIPHSGSGIINNAPVNDSTENAVNLTSVNGTKSSNSSHTKKATCSELEKSVEIQDVEVVNATTLLKLLQSNANISSRSTAAECFLIYFFSPYCPFSTQGSAYVNALARAVPNIPVFGLNSVDYHSLNARYGIMGTPSLVLFHNGHTVGRYNASEYSTYYLESFIRHFTNQEINSINVTSQDFKASLPSTTMKSSNIALFIAWSFLLFCAGYVFLKSEFYAKLTEAVLNNWREAEAQHEHNE